MHDLNEWWVVVEATMAFEIAAGGTRSTCGEHDAALHEALQPYVSAGRKQHGNGQGQVGRRSSR